MYVYITFGWGRITFIIAFVESLWRLGGTLWTKLVHPTTCGETWYRGSFGKNLEWGTLFSIEEEDILLIRKETLGMAFSQWTLVFNIRECAISVRCLFFLSTILFCCGVWGHAL